MYSADKVDRGNRQQDGREYYKVTRRVDEMFIGYLIKEVVKTEERTLVYWHAENELPKESEKMSVKTKDVEPCTNPEAALLRLLKVRKKRGGA